MNQLSQVRAFLSVLSWPWVEVWFYRPLQYPIRGLADDALLRRALDEISDGTWYEICGLNTFYPEECGDLGHGDTHDELSTDFDSIRGKHVAIGPIPQEGPLGEDQWVHDHANDVLYVSYNCNDYYRSYNWTEAELEAAKAEWEGEA